MPKKTSVKMENKNLKALITAFENLPVARVGILQAKNQRPDDDDGGNGLTNVELGTLMEFGGSTMPARSFLRMPIAEKLDEFLEDRGAFEKENIKQVIAEKSLNVWMGKVAATAADTVAEAFKTGGFGQWKPSDMKYKKNKQTLVEEGFLRDSVGWDIKE